MHSDKDREQHDNAYHLLNIKTSPKHRTVSARKEDFVTKDWYSRTGQTLAHPINHAFCSVCHRLVPFRQKFGQNRKILHWILRGFRVGLKIDNVDRRMPGKISLEGRPGAR